MEASSAKGLSASLGKKRAALFPKVPELGLTDWLQSQLCLGGQGAGMVLGLILEESYLLRAIVGIHCLSRRGI